MSFRSCVSLVTQVSQWCTRVCFRGVQSILRDAMLLVLSSESTCSWSSLYLLISASNTDSGWLALR